MIVIASSLLNLSEVAIEIRNYLQQYDHTLISHVNQLFTRPSLAKVPYALLSCK